VRIEASTETWVLEGPAAIFGQTDAISRVDGANSRTRCFHCSQADVDDRAGAGVPLTAGYLALVCTDMNVPEPSRPRPYRMRVRAEAAAETRGRILRAVLELHVERFHDQITLEDIAERAGVTVQTVLRHFGSRDRLVTAAAEQAMSEVLAQRSGAPVGDIEGAVENLLDHYEEWGRSALRLLAQEERVPQLRVLADAGRAAHYAWVERTFAPFLAETSDPLLRAQLIALTDVFVWKLLRLDLGLDRTATASALASTIHAVVGKRSQP
jgi:AcrR family transcriptional regulator